MSKDNKDIESKKAAAASNEQKPPEESKKADTGYTGFIVFHTPCYVDFCNYKKGQILDVTKEQQAKFAEYAEPWTEKEKE